MMEFLYLALTGKVFNLLMVSNSYDNACRLLLPFQLQLEKNARIINDYGDQVNPGNWETGQFVAKCGCSFRAIGAGQSPRGTRNEAKRPIPSCRINALSTTGSLSRSSSELISSGLRPWCSNQS